MTMPWGYRVFRKLCPHGEWPVAEGLWRQGSYRKWLNYLLVEFQLARGHELSLGRPYWLTVDPTNFCQLQCPFCPTGAGRGVRDKGNLRLDHFQRLMDRLGSAVVHMDMMNWGEPVLNKDLPAMIEIAKRHGIEVKVDANLNDLSEAMAEGLVRSGLDILSVSIDGASQGTYEEYRIRGSLDRVLDNVRLVARKKKELGSPTPRLIWQFLVFKHNEHEQQRARELARELEMDDINFVAPYMPNEPKVLEAWLAEDRPYQLYARPASSGDKALARPGDVIKVQTIPSFKSYRARRFRREQLWSSSHLWRRLDRDVWRRAWSAFRQAQDGAARGAASVPYDQAAPQPLCKWPWAGMTVNPEGSVAPCCSVEDQGDDFGNIFSRAFGGLWNGAMYRRSRRHVRRYAQGREGIVPDSEHVCERCTAIGYANFKFPAKAAAQARGG